MTLVSHHSLWDTTDPGNLLYSDSGDSDYIMVTISCGSNRDIFIPEGGGGRGGIAPLKF